MGDGEIEVLSLRGWRRRRLHTIRSLAVTAQAAPRTIVELEGGRREPRVGTIRAVSAALGVAPEQVMEFRRVMNLPADEEAINDR